VFVCEQIAQLQTNPIAATMAFTKVSLSSPALHEQRAVAQRLRHVRDPRFDLAMLPDIEQPRRPDAFRGPL
jgi:hypothetical protein